MIPASASGRMKIRQNNLVDLPADLDHISVNESKVALLFKLNTEYKTDDAAKIASIDRMLQRFKDGTIDPKLNYRHHWWAAQLAKLELQTNLKLRRLKL